jgi:serine protease Do
MRHTAYRGSLFFVLIFVMITVGWGKYTLAMCQSTSEVGPIMAPETEASAPDLTTVIVEVAKETIPSVAHIQVTERQEVANPLFPFSQSPMFRRFFGIPKNLPKTLEKELIGVGSGIIIDAGGHILTNNHVVAGATKIDVSLSDGTHYTGKVVGTDPLTDVGVIQISPEKPLPYLMFGNSDQVEVGQWVVAVGQPEGLNESVTQGIISAKHRAGISNPESYQDFLQTDAPINPGNSGGPLLSLHGEVIGVNSAILSQSGGFEGIGFAIPSNMAVHVAKALIANGKVIRGWLGADVQDLTPELAKSSGLKTTQGAMVVDVVTGSPADEAGIEKKDVIVKYRSKGVPNASMLRNDVTNTPVGQEVEVTVWRDGKEKRLTVKIGNLEDATKALLETVKKRLGVEVAPMTAEDAQRLGLRVPQGVVVQWVDPKGPLGKAGFEKGDFILQLDGQTIGGVDQFAALVNTLAKNQKIVLLAVDPKTGESGYVHAEVD